MILANECFSFFPFAEESTCFLTCALTRMSIWTRNNFFVAEFGTVQATVKPGHSKQNLASVGVKLNSLMPLVTFVC